MSARSTCHGTFVVERSLDASPARVFAAFATPEAKDQWFAGPGAWTREIREMDFREGGHERVRGVWPGGSSDFRATYHDIVPGERIVYSYEMFNTEARISVSIATILIAPEGRGARLTFTEQGVFMDHDPDGPMGPASRERGTNDLMDQLAAALARGPARA
jgi:uncharacterized protein YndB with AHSA1/START domain